MLKDIDTSRDYITTAEAARRSGAQHRLPYSAAEKGYARRRSSCA